MSRYPDDPIPSAPYPFRSNRPLVSGGPEGNTQDRALFRFGLAEADLSYIGLRSWAEDMKTLYDFFENVGGPAGRFTFADFNEWDTGGLTWSGLFVAKSDGIAISWDLPTFALQSSPAPVIYENGVSKTSDIYTTTWDDTKLYHIKVGAGTDGVDLLTAEAALGAVTTAPSPATSGTTITVLVAASSPFSTPPFYANVWPTGVAPTEANIETVQVTGMATIDGHTIDLTIVRAQNGTLARTIIVGDQIAVPPSPTVLITVDAKCRRAFRRAKFANVKNPFAWDPPEMSTAGTITILEVRK